jgi:integrase/recombinase XerC
LERAKVDFDALTLTVMGKGSKERVVPFSHVCRKILFRYVAQEHQGRLLFGTRTGSRLSYRNAYRAIQGICVRAGVKADVHPHAFRHTFAAAFVKAGGDVFRLSRFLGHSALSTTQLYLRSLGTAELARNEQRLSPLARFDRI